MAVPGINTIYGTGTNPSDQKQICVYFTRGANTENIRVSFIPDGGTSLNYTVYAFINPTQFFDLPFYNWSYTVKIYGISIDGTMGSWGNTWTFSTGSAPVVYPDTPSIGTIDMNGRTAAIHYSTGANTSYVMITLSNPSTGWSTTFSSTGTPASGVFPEYGTYYGIAMYAVSSTGTTSSTTYSGVYTQTEIGIPSAYSTTITPGSQAITIWYTRGMNNESVEAVFYYNDGATIQGYSSRNYDTGGSPSIAYTLSPYWSYTYYYRLRGYTSDGRVSTLSQLYAVNIGVQNTRPANWAWAVAKTQNANITTTKMTDILWYIYPISSTDWIAFTDKINKFLAYKGLSLGFYNPISGGSDFTTDILMQAINNINRMLSTDFVEGASVSNAYVYARMRDRLNSIP